jgi:hypothetical protein
MSAFFLLGLMLAAVACISLYLASPHQRWRRAPWPVRPARGAAALLLVGALFTLLEALQVATAIFVFAHWLMLLLVLFPYLGAFISSRQQVSS